MEVVKSSVRLNARFSQSWINAGSYRRCHENHYVYRRLPGVSISGLRRSQGRGWAGIRCHGVDEVNNTEILICTNRTCRKDGSLQTVQYFRDLAPPGVKIDTTGCIGKCGNGPNLVMLPSELIISHCNTASHVARLLALQCGAPDPETNLKALNLKYQGNSAFEGGNPQRAEELYTEAIGLRPSGGLHLLYANRSAARVALGNFQGSLEDAQSAAKEAPDWAGAVMRQAEALTKLGDIQGAAATYRKAATMDSSLVKKVQRRLKELERQCIESNVLEAS
ncbi:stress-induced-phosphoprotein 1 [Klebsormidium nitens]|uniref:Stress-induced-phosphoprotein 1 n=1 Tax=Klebsormidium nitens TaxID=105231 RepID=A0A1Y1HPJ4_KLENI|nr:stress-induced-phosphoprotein 1 [Klebsormidium nitens]|eukprot:GAQ79129.1 stress-induced-phosphoprotein 1 [Klebsormidium nitens]